MAHNFKRPASINPRERREEKQISFMASLIRHQEALDTLLAGSPPEMRAAMLARLLPYLEFIPVELIADCPHCGLQRGAAVQHECVAEPMVVLA